MQKKRADSREKQGQKFGMLFDAPHFEMNSNNEVIIEGSRGVLEYTQEVIRINTNKMVVTFKGRGLNVKCISPQELIINGFITCIEFSV